MVKCKRYKNEIVTYTDGYHRFFLDQFSDEEEIWKNSCTIPKTDYFMKNYGLTQKQAYDLIMQDEDKKCPYCNREKQFISYIRGYSPTCDNEKCIKEWEIKDYKIFQFVMPESGEIIEYPRDQYCTIEIFGKYLEDLHIKCPIHNCKEEYYNGCFEKTPRDDYVDKETNRQVYKFNAINWKCCHHKLSETSHEHMMNLHHGNSEIALDYQRRLKNGEWQYKFTKEDCSNGGIAARETTIAYNKSDYGRENSRRRLKKTWEEQYGYMLQCLLKHISKCDYIQNMSQEQYDKTCYQLSEFLNDYYKDDTFMIECCLETVGSSWFNLIKECFRKNSTKNVPTFFYYAKAHDNEEIYKIGITNNPNGRYGKTDRFYNLIPIKEYPNRYVCAYIEYKIRTIFCYDNTEITDKDNLDLIIDYVNNFEITDRVKQELQLLGLPKKTIKYFN